MFSCKGCNKPDSWEDMVACDKCENWFHYSCASVNIATIHSDEFICVICKAKVVAPESKRGSSVRSSSSSTRSEKLHLKLQQLEEAKAMRKKHEELQRSLREARLKLLREEEEEQSRMIHEEATYLSQKHELELAQIEELEDEGNRSRISLQSSERKVEEWIQRQLQIGNEGLGLEHQSTAKLEDCVEEIHSADPIRPMVRNQRDVQGNGVRLGIDNKEVIRSVGRVSRESDKQSLASSVRDRTMYLSLPPSGGKLVQQDFHTQGACVSKLSLVDWSSNPTVCNVCPPGEKLAQQDFHSTIDRVSKLSLVHRNSNPCGVMGATASNCTTKANIKSKLNQEREYADLRGTMRAAENNDRLPVTSERLMEQDFHSNVDRMSKLSLAHRNVEPPMASEYFANPVRVPHPERPAELNRDKIAARQVMPKELPVFDGNPEDWPIFLSCYKMTTEACGYSDVENLMRLQRSLRGPALEAVRSRLLIPSAVPSVIRTLQMLFGKPELVVNMLLKKVREVPSPKPERLDMLITFGMAVQNLCDHLEAAEMSSHMCNPVLLQELIDKLPAGCKMDWARYRKQFTGINLRTFGDFMEILVLEANSVTMQVFPELKGLRDHQKYKPYTNVHDIKPDAHSEGNEAATRAFVSCSGCKNEEHSIANCEAFQKLIVQDKLDNGAQHKFKLCRQCLGRHGKIDGQWSCPSGTTCGVGGCSKPHHELLHAVPQKPAERVTTALVSHHRLLNTTFFRIIPIRLYGSCSVIDTYAMLDDGSSATLIEENLANQLGAEGKPDPLCLVWTANMSRSEKDSRRVDLEISGSNTTEKYPLIDVRTVSELALPKQTVCVNALSKQFAHLDGLPIVDYNDVAPRILIGSNNAHLLVSLRSREGQVGEPVAVKSRLGWSIFGGVSKERDVVNFHAVTLCECRQSDEQIHELVKTYFAVDSVGAEGSRPESDDEKRAKRILETTTIRLSSNRFETGLL